MKQISVNINRIEAWAVWTLNVPESFPTDESEYNQLAWLEANPTLIEWACQENEGDCGFEFSSVVEMP